MKYGDTLRQRSIPAWSHHNIDYDDIKLFIKDHTTPGTGKAVSVPGRGDDKLAELDNALFSILQDQHHRIQLFVRSKAGEIQRRLDHSKKQTRQLITRKTSAANHRIPASRLERYSKLENDVIKSGDEIKSLARFAATQRTAFRKLLKKYKKWTGSRELEDRFRDEILDDPKSFTKLDLGPLLDDFSLTRQQIRDLYESQMAHSMSGPRHSASRGPLPGSSTNRQLRDALEPGSRLLFDTSMATVPFGDRGTFTSYFVHPENVVELQMLLLQYSRFFLSRSRSNSIATPVSTEPQRANFGNQSNDVADYHMLVADNLDSFAREQSALTVNDREFLLGSSPQRAKVTVRWNNTEDALACVRAKSGRTKSAFLKNKRVNDFLDVDTEFASKQDTAHVENSNNIKACRQELLKGDIKPLFHYSACRSRLVGLDEDPDGQVLATLDTAVTINNANGSTTGKAGTAFPFALLLVRQEGRPRTDLIAALDDSHLVERVRGFSIEYHAVWETQRPSNMPPPFWLPILSRDIRKLPPPAVKRGSGLIADNGERGPVSSRSNGSFTAGTDSATAVETSRDAISQLESPPLQSFRKKKRRNYPEPGTASQQRYWSEYDHLENGDNNEDGFFLYIDPNEKSRLDSLFDRLASVFRRREKAEEEPLLADPGTPVDDESSSDEATGTTATDARTRKGFGTFGPTGSAIASQAPRGETKSGLGHFSATCFSASMAILVVAYILRSTGRHKYLREEHIGVLFAMACSLAFVLVGFMSVLRGNNASASAWAVSVVVLLVDIIGSGGLLAWLLG